MLTVAPVAGSNGPLSLACAGGPPNTTGAVSPSSVSLGGGAVSAKATVTLLNGAPKGTYAITFTTLHFTSEVVAGIERVTVSAAGKLG